MPLHTVVAESRLGDLEGVEIPHKNRNDLPARLHFGCGINVI